jgi:hypothetical protein
MLDVVTPAGLRSVEDFDEAVALWESANVGWRVALLPRDRQSDIDGFLIDPLGDVAAVIEGKCRYGITLDDFRTTFGNSWLVTMDKLVRGAAVARSLRVPFVGFLYIAADGVLLTRRLADEDGTFAAPFECRRTTTQKSINGGVADRANAFIDMTDCREYRRSGCQENRQSSL